ncbi:MAG: flagellin, partial [Planctomycetota bacterium]
MGLRVNTNIPSLNAQRNLETITARLNVNYRRLSTGLRITTAADDAAGLAISERLRSQIRSLQQAKRNANDGISLVQTTEGALNESSSILVRMRELAVQAANGSVSSSDKGTLNEEFLALVGEIQRIGTNWDRDKVLVGHVLKVGPHPNADRLTLPSVDLGGGERITVVCGAPNVAAGQKIAFAREGARL